MKIRSTATVLVLMAAFWVANPGTASAQVGVLVGLNSANVDFDVEEAGVSITGDRRMGFVGGLTFNLPVQEMFSVELDALFAQKGSEISVPAEDFSQKVKLNYLDLPVLGRINLPGSGPARVHLLVGPSFNFNISEKFDPDEGEDDEVETFETALVFGGGVTVNRFRVDVRYGLGLSNIVKDSEAEGITGKNRVFSILVGFGS